MNGNGAERCACCRHATLFKGDPLSHTSAPILASHLPAATGEEEEVFSFPNCYACRMEHPPLPRLVSGNCPACSSSEIVVKTIEPDGISYAGYCPGCGVDLSGALVDGANSAVVL